MYTHTTPDIMRFRCPEPEHYSMLVIFYLKIMEFFTLSILKSRLTSRFDHDNVPKYYYYDPRLTQILHARLRMRSNSLNEHLYICAYKIYY